jgi:hypothetical protein
MNPFTEKAAARLKAENPLIAAKDTLNHQKLPREAGIATWAVLAQPCV